MNKTARNPGAGGRPLLAGPSGEVGGAGGAEAAPAAGRRPAALGGRRFAQAACAAGLAYAAISVYWAAGGTWLLGTVGSALGQSGHAGDTAILAAVWAAAALKLIGAVLPLAAAGGAAAFWPAAAARGRRRQALRALRALTWAEAGILTVYGLVLSGTGWLEQAGVIATPAGADHRALAWHAFLWDPWFLLWGLLVTAALLRSRGPRVR